MKITKEVLKKYQAPKEWFDFLEKNFPEGAEALEIMNNSKMSNFNISLLHFAARFFQFNEKELAEYYKICDIKNSTNCFWNENVDNSQNIYYSFNIFNSKYVTNSSNISDSSFVYDSQEIHNSNEIYNCNEVNQSFAVMNSDNIRLSKEINESKNVLWSRKILNSLFVDDCSYIYQSIKVTDCHFCGFLSNCTHCLFCSGLSDSEYYIFNEEVTQVEYERALEKLHFMETLNEANNSSFIMIDSGKYEPIKRYKLSRRFDSIFEGLSADFYGYIGTVINYNEDVFLQLFLTDENLIFS